LVELLSVKNQHVPKSCNLQLSGCSRKSKVDDTGVVLMLHCHQVTKVSITGNQDALFLARDRKDGMVGQGVRVVVGNRSDIVPMLSQKKRYTILGIFIKQKPHA